MSSSQRDMEEHYKLMSQDINKEVSEGSGDEIDGNDLGDEMDNFNVHDGKDARARGDETIDSGRGGGSETTGEAKRQWQQRRPNKVGTTKEIVLAVDEKTGLPTEPKSLARGY